MPCTKYNNKKVQSGSVDSQLYLKRYKSSAYKSQMSYEMEYIDDIDTSKFDMLTILLVIHIKIGYLTMTSSF